MNNPVAASLDVEPSAPGAAGSPAHQEYSRRLKDREAEASRLQHKHLWLGNVRIAVFLAILVQCW
ncbi:MAG TPA: hypothetical protein VNB54_02220, partial [Alphaproteobacteria bacterium]|nr:hypothetical protein [Alphaproteobacteria bacterium]